jgi:hypothetical protein
VNDNYQEPKSRRRGPGAHTVYRQSDRKLFPQLARLVEKYHGNVFAAALQLAEAGKVAGEGTARNKAHRLAARFRASLPRRPHPARPEPALLRKLFPQMQRIIEKHDANPYQAALELVRAGKVPGKARRKSKAQRLATRFRDSRKD